MELILQENEIPKLLEILDLPNHRGIYLLSGNLASGKTTLVKAFAKVLGVTIPVTSPTYLTALEYGNGIYHYDIYHSASITINICYSSKKLEGLTNESFICCK